MKKVHMIAGGILIFLAFSSLFLVFMAMINKDSSDGSAIELRISSLLILLLTMGIIIFLSLKYVEMLGAG
jgi:hypothetical protein